MSSYRARRSARHAFLIASLVGLAPPLAKAQAAPSPSAWPVPPAPSGTVAVGSASTPQPADPSPGNGQRIAGFGLMGVGAVGIAVGAIFGLSVSAKNRDIDAICPTGQPCSPQSVADYNSAVADAKIARAAAMVGFGVGALFVGTGVVLVLTAPQRASGGAVWLTPLLGSSGTGAACSGTW
jgi:hypothetical protein